MTRSQSAAPESATSTAQRLLSLAVHELRTPASVIGGCLKIVRLAPADDLSRREQALGQAERNYDRLVELLAEMSDLWRLDAGQAVFNRHRVGVAPVVERAAATVASRLDMTAPVVLELEQVKELHVFSDPVRLERALTAVGFAVARQGGGTTLAIRARRSTIEDRAALQLIFETGPPAELPADIRRMPFDEFQSGQGLALPIARRVIEDAGGSVYAVADIPRLVGVELPES